MPKLDETGIGIEKATGRRTVRICVDGKRYFETMPEGATLGQACARRDDMRKEAAGGGLKPGAPLTIEGLLRLVEVDHAAKHVSRATVKKFATASRRLVAHFGADTPAARVKFSHLQEFRLQMQADYSIALTNVTLSFFQYGFRLAFKSELIDKYPPFEFPNPHNEREVHVTDDQLTALLEHLPEYLHPVIELAPLIGFRINSELLPRRWRDYDAVSHKLTVPPRTTKDGRAREVTLSGRPLEIVEALRARSAVSGKFVNVDQYIFLNRRGDSRIVSYQDAWQKARAAIGLPGLRVHDLRHVFCARGVASGHGYDSLRSFTGHCTPKMFSRYVGAASPETQVRVLNDMALTKAARAAAGDSGSARSLPEKVTPLLRKTS